jgi:hypothetical protein
MYVPLIIIVIDDKCTRNRMYSQFVMKTKQHSKAQQSFLDLPAEDSGEAILARLEAVGRIPSKDKYRRMVCNVRMYVIQRLRSTSSFNNLLVYFVRTVY